MTTHKRYLMLCRQYQDLGSRLHWSARVASKSLSSGCMHEKSWAGGNSHTDRRKTLIPQDFSKHPLKTKDNADVSCGSSASWLRHLPRSWCTCTWGSRWFQCVDSIDLFSRFRPALNSIEQSIEKLAPSLHFSISPAFWASDQSFKFSHRLACEATF